MTRNLLALAALFAAAQVSAQSITPGVSYALIAQHSGHCLEVEDASLGEGAAVVQSRCDAERESQVFMFSRAADGYLTLHPIHSGHCVGVGGGETHEGAPVTQYSCHGGENQQLRVQRNDDGTYTMTARHTGHCVGVGAAATSAGASVTQYACHGEGNQRWYAYRLGDRVPVRDADR